MDNDFIDKIVKWQKSGARVLLRRNSFGKGRVKVVAGPFGVLTRRFEVNTETYEAIKRVCFC